MSLATTTANDCRLENKMDEIPISDIHQIFDGSAYPSTGIHSPLQNSTDGEFTNLTSPFIEAPGDCHDQFWISPSMTDSTDPWSTNTPISSISPFAIPLIFDFEVVNASWDIPPVPNFWGKTDSRTPSATPSTTTGKDLLSTYTLKPQENKIKSAKAAIADQPLGNPANSDINDGGHTSGLQLRTASRKPKKRSRKKTREASLRSSPKECTHQRRLALDSHNQVEKQYRERLNMQYMSLLTMLPADLDRKSIVAHTTEASDDTGGRDTGGNGDTRGGRVCSDNSISKGEVLDMARMYIERMEREGELLLQERDRLLSSADLIVM
ncbi:hypothetical protein BGZ61DRAFT_231450 [Ilyonectria robusta]|uniref:uncharacterized protein n=1 Tax=Ilyonectria robusta TaxID=1079257 RepID=UPI001E8ECCE8|nr:uncharacterized protein BGZ61DRAFT_231450 [Ilyonectria robusta]KAH8650801.1 hypothetical protein BGZ61DRAFT_231450 [Ilyonectria robusta]